MALNCLLAIVALTSVSLCEQVKYVLAYLMMMCSLAVIHDTPCIPSLASLTMYVWMLHIE